MLNKIKDWLDVRIGLNELISTQLIETRCPKISISLYSRICRSCRVLYSGRIGNISPDLLYPSSGPGLQKRAEHHEQSALWMALQTDARGWQQSYDCAAFLHLLTIFLMGNYKRPRELTWVGGAFMLLITLIFA